MATFPALPKPRRRASRAGAALVAFCLLAATLTPPAALAQRAPRFRGQPLTLNFVNADIESVARAMSSILRQQFVVDPRVRGNITLYSDEPLTPNEAYLNFLSALRGLGFTVVEVRGIFKVVPEADAKLQGGTVTIGENTGRRGDQVLTQIFRLQHENANNLVPVLRPLITPNNTINANPGNNTLVITDYADNLQRLGQIITAMDVPSASDVDVIPLRYAVAADIAPLIQRLSDANTAASTVPNAPGSLAPSILIDSRSNSLIVRSSSPARLTQIRGLVARLDVPPQGAAASGNIWVVHLKNADATKLATVLRAAFGSGGGQGSGGAVSLPTALTTSTAQLPGGTGTTTGAAGAPITPSASPSTGGFIQADPATNSLVISAPEPLYRQVRAMIDQLDARRAQVYIESMIVEVSGTNDADFGFQWQGVLGNKNDRNIIVGGTNLGSTGNLLSIDQAQLAGTATSALLGEGLNIGLVRNFFGSYGLAAIARLLQSQANTNIMSTPNIVTLDNEEAKIIVGSNVPFVTGQYTATAGTGALANPFQTIERKDVGITLRIKPQISDDGSIRMTIFQESSSLAAETAPGTSNAGPTTNKRSIESNVIVEDGRILVLGGLIEDRYSDNTSKVPVLGDIPYVGALFRSQTRSKSRTNLMVFLRPTVMRDGESSSQLSAERYEQIRTFQKEQQPTPNIFIPIKDSPVAPPLGRLQGSETPISAPQTSPGTEPGALRKPKAPPADAATPVIVPIIVPAPMAPPPAAPASAAAG